MTPRTLDLSHQDSFLALAREEDHLQQSLQTLIDAQSEGLLAGFSHQQEHDTSSTGSRTPTTSVSVGRSTNNGQKTPPVTPVRQPAKRKVGLQGARRDISNAIDELAIVKTQEGHLLATALREKEQELAITKGLALKRTGLQERIQAVEEAAETPQQGRSRDELQAAERALADEISETETKLWNLQARHRHLRTEIATLDNSVQAKLSSYRAALALAETEAHDFLKREGHGTAMASNRIGNSNSSSSSSSSGRQGLWALPPDRRTLGMAEEQFRAETETLRQQAEGAEAERKALEEGALVWREVVQEVGRVETMLRDEMMLHHHQHASPPSLSPPPPPPRSSSASASIPPLPPTATPLRAMLRQMRAATGAIETHLRRAEERGWSLLVCTIGAELEALREGGRVLEGVLGSDVGDGVGGGDEGRGGEEDEDGPGVELLVEREGEGEGEGR